MKHKNTNQYTPCSPISAIQTVQTNTDHFRRTEVSAVHTYIPITPFILVCTHSDQYMQNICMCRKVSMINTVCFVCIYLLKLCCSK